MKICPECKTEYLGGEVFCPNDGSRLLTRSEFAKGPPDDPLIGQTIDKYRVIRRIGEGGMGLVYEAVHTVIEKRVAMKVLRDDFSKKPDVVERFQLEAKSASRIGHENIVDISDFGVTPAGASYFVMEFLEGEDLATKLARDGVLSPPVVVDVLLQCCAALGAAHDKGVIHRDMKPENIYLTARGGGDTFVKLVDFGIAKISEVEAEGAGGRKLTKTGMVFGTPEYMSPEQAAGKALDHRVDIYALGVILFECLTGRVPFVGDSFMGILTQHIFDPMPRPSDVDPEVSCAPALEAVIARATAKDPDDRYASTEEMARDLRAALEGPVGDLAPPPRGRADAPGARRLGAPSGQRAPGARRGVYLALAALAAALVVGWFARGASSPTGPPGAAEASAGSAPLAEAATRGGPAGDVPAASEASRDGGTADAEPPAGDASVEVVIRVETTPEGALARIEGAEASCEPTPCDLVARAGDAVTISASRGSANGETTVTPQGRTTVQLALTAPPPRRARRVRRETREPSRPEARRDDDLKVPDIFR